jgi:hypothetical protein
LRTKGSNQSAEIGRKYAEINDLKVELDKRAALIFALRARSQVRQAITRRVVKVLLYMFIRSGRRRRAFLRPRQVGAVRPAPAAVLEREAA